MMRLRPTIYSVSPCAIILALGLGAVLSARADDSVQNASGGDRRPAIPNAQCPVLPEEPVDPSISTEYQGHMVYFCCAKCRTQFLANPERYLEKLPQFATTLQQTALPEGGSTPMDDHTMPEETAHEHDHATDHATGGGLRRLVAYLGKLHPLAVHLPIGILVAGALAELLAVLRRKESYEEVSFFCVVVGALAAVVTAALGWAAGANAHYSGEMGFVLESHRWAGTATAALATGTALLAVVGKRVKNRRRLLRAGYRVFLVLTVAAMTLAGHLGATLIYGVGHLSW